MSSLKVFEYKGQTIEQREDGYINLTQMCQANGKRVNNFLRMETTKAYIQELSIITLKSAMELVEVKHGGDVQDSSLGTWAHRLIAIRCAQWISPAFAVWCDAHIFNLMEKGETKITDQVIEVQEEPQRALPEYSAIEYSNAAYQAYQLPNGILKQLLIDSLVDELELVRNIKYLPVAEKPKKYTIVKVRAKQLGYSEAQIGDGTQLGKFVKSRVAPAFQEMIGRYPVFHYEINDDLDSAIRDYFR